MKKEKEIITSIENLIDYNNKELEKLGKNYDEERYSKGLLEGAIDAYCRCLKIIIGA